MRRGMETNEFLGLVIAIIGVVLLGFFGVKLYNFFVDQEMKNAQAFVDDLAAKIDLLGEGENNTFALRGVSGWVLTGWNKEVPIALEGQIINQTLKPQKCFENSCICLCLESVSKCQESGYCKNIDRNVNVSSLLTYTSGNDEGGYTAKVVLSCIFQNNQLASILVDKKSNIVSIFQDYGERESQWVSENKMNGPKKEGLELFSNENGPVGKIEDSCLLSQQIISRF